MKDRLQQVQLDDEEAAQARAWAVVRQAAAEQPIRPRRRWRLALASVATVAAVTVAVTPPGAAVADWVVGRVDPKPAPVVRPHAATRLPGGGRLLIRDAQGIAILKADGTKTRLGEGLGGAWSPHGLFVATYSGPTITAMEPNGKVHWRVQSGAGSVYGGVRWSNDGYRIAYLAGDARLRIVNGDGTGDRGFARALPIVPAWRPKTGSSHQLAYIGLNRRIQVRDTDTGKLVYEYAYRASRRTTKLEWTPDGSQLMILSPGGLHVLNMSPHEQAVFPDPPAGARYVAAAESPNYTGIATVTAKHGRFTLEAGGHAPFGGAGSVRSLTFSPDGKWVLLDWRSAHQLVAVKVQGTPRIETLPGATVLGWRR